MTETVKAYAKINLHLDVTAKRPDGYHDVQNVMQSVSLHDTISVSPTDEKGIFISCDKSEVPTGEGNIAFKAARLFFEHLGEAFSEYGVNIEIQKNIPMAAGLAGGSADAAGTLLALNRIFKNKFSPTALCQMGSRLGADVPFCIMGGCAYSDGRGDALHSFPAVPSDAIFVVACGGEGVSTPWAYKLLDGDNNDFSGYSPRGTKDLREALLANDGSYQRHIFNLFEKSVLPLRPIAEKIKEQMLLNGAQNAMMSGSGPSVYGIFKTHEEAKKAVKEINSMGYFAEACSPIFTVYNQK